MSDRDRYRDNDDVRDPVRDRAGTSPDSKTEARGDARANVGNHSRGTDAEPSGPEGNDRTLHRPDRGEYDADLERDNRSRSDS